LAGFVVEAPATIANLGPGFDIFGLALQWANVLEVETTRSPGVRIDHRGEGAGTLATTAGNLSYRALLAVLAHVHHPVPGIRMRQRNVIPVQRGLGSSAAAVAAGLRAGAALAGAALPADELLRIGLPLEGHPDNLAAALCGGLCICAPTATGHAVTRLDFPDWDIVLLIPDALVATAEARALLPSSVPRGDAVFNAARCALWIAAVARRDLGLLRQATEDRWHQDARARLFPPLPRLLDAARQAGAAGAVLAGSGSAIAAFAARGQGRAVGAGLKGAARAAGVPAQVRVTHACNEPRSPRLRRSAAGPAPAGRTRPDRRTR